MTETYSEIDVKLDREQRILWVNFLHKDRLCVTLQVIKDWDKLLKGLLAEYKKNGTLPFSHLIVGSKRTGIFNLGGDLATFASCHKTQDRKRLLEYAEESVKILHSISSLELPFVTVSLIQGDALGGGFELTLATQVRVAEPGVKLGFPECRFGLFPGMGAWSFLSRTISDELTERLIETGEIVSSDLLSKEKNFLQLSEPGKSKELVLEIIKKQQRNFPSELSKFRARAKRDNVFLEELESIVRTWTDAALALSSDNVRKMEVLVSAQSRKIKAQSEECLTERKNT